MRSPITLRPATLAVAAVLLASAATATGRKSDREALANARPAGKPVDCVQIVSIRETRVRSDDVIDFFMNGGTVYRNTLPHSCPRLGFEEAFAYKTSLSQLCSVDIITVLERSGGVVPGASCGLGAFQPVTGVAR